MAASTPLRTPPLPINVMPGSSASVRIDSGVGIPQSANTSPKSGSPARSPSIRAQLVPPLPAVSKIRKPSSWSARAARAERPLPISLAIAGTESPRATSPSLATSPRKSRCPSGWMASCSGLRWKARASAPIIATAASHSAAPTP